MKYKYMPPRRKKETFTYRVLPLDVDGDNIPDGDLVEKVNSLGIVVSRKFVPTAKILKAIKNAQLKKGGAPPSKQVVEPNQNVMTQQPVYVADQTSLGQSIKTGFGVGLGASAGAALFDGLASLF